MSSLQDRVARAMLSIVPADGSTIGNTALRREIEKQLQSEGLAMGDDDYWQAHSALVADGVLVKGPGRGGSVRRAPAGAKVEPKSSGDLADDAGGFALQVQLTPEPLGAQTTPKAPASAKRPTAPGTRSAAGEAAQIISYRHADKRKNNPEVGMVTPATDPEAGKDIDALKGITALKVQMNTDLLTEDLKKARASNQSFWLMGQPEVEVHALKDGRYEVEVHGFDYFDTVKGELVSGGKRNIAM